MNIQDPAGGDAADDVPLWMFASLQQNRESSMTPVLARAMLIAYITARRVGPVPIDRFLTLFPDAGPPEREVLVSLNADLVEAEAAGEDMESVFDETEVSIGAQLMREVQRGIGDMG